MHRSSPRRASIALLVVLVAAPLAACGGGNSAPGGGRARAESGPRAVVTARPEPIAYRRTLELGATLEPSERVEIAARVEGAITGLDAELGDRVSRGATLARITAEDFAARTAEIDAQLAQARTELARAEQLVGGDLAPRESLEQARTKVRVAEAQRRLAGRQLRDTRVVAPFDGAIAERLVSPGAFVRVGTPLFVLVATSPMRLALDVPERHARDVRPGTLVSVSAAAGELDAAVTRISPVVDPETRTFRAEVEVPGDVGLVPGTYVRARIDLGPVDGAVRVPRAAVFEVLGRARVIEVVEGRAQPRDVEMIGEEDDAAIVTGVAEGAEVVARSPGLLAPGTEVRAGDGDGDREGAPAATGAPATEAPATEAATGSARRSEGT